ncbi:vanillate O-demethylase oxidoreductase VanB [Rhodanobacter sp. B05]|uniref:SRPBCC family protein n=1 Tax=Rhodanobacter sp. B05 TaxID=1945859 RepID=UPI00098530C5|nr:SRPBCC family protein [Rhodanobacter sp. B05]OOG54682.1 vanillate O-demethylase oxidoreductase VanB [Rhodanobacter sp. B05]
MNASTDRIEKQILLKAPRPRVWHALADAETFGDWFGVALKGQRFVAGESAHGHITYPGYEHLQFEITLERIEPEHLLSFHWHPYAVDATRDYSNEPPTRVVFELEEVDGGTLLRVVESGFDRIPAERRAEAFRMNSGGWDQQMKNILHHVATH